MARPSRRLRALTQHVGSGSSPSSSGTSATATASSSASAGVLWNVLPEQADAQLLQAEQRRLTGDAAGYRPESITPWVWDTEQTVEGVRWSYSHTRELTLTANVSRGAATPSALPAATLPLDLGAIKFTAVSSQAVWRRLLVFCSFSLIFARTACVSSRRARPTSLAAAGLLTWP